jgi:predicted N-acetyltransferase YhbS
VVIEKLSEQYDFANFQCGRANLDAFLKTKALIYNKNVTSKTYVAVDGGQVIGYYSLTVAGLFQRYCPDSLTAGIDEETIPVVLLGKLAVHQERQSAGIGRGLFKDALKKILAVSEIVGARELLVHAADAEAKEWYSQFDFDVSPADSLHLFLPMDDIRHLVG